tara:strand:+ start:19951 stop:20259 length:309 start_codon:yes stop_codon:yes gene_type:complete
LICPARLLFCPARFFFNLVGLEEKEIGAQCWQSWTCRVVVLSCKVFFNLVGLEEKEIGVQCSMLAKLKLDLQGFQNLLGLGLERRRMNMQRWVEVGYSLQQG